MKRLILILLLCSTYSYAADFEFGLGSSWFKPNINTTWYQEGFPYALHTQSLSGSIGVVDKFLFTPKFTDGMKWRIGYEYMGEVKTHSMATTDANYNASTHGCNGTCLSLATLDGTSTTQGVYASVLPMWNIGSGYAYIEAGIYLYRTQFKMHMTGIVQCSACTPYNAYVGQDPIWSIHPIVGTGYAYGANTIAITYRNVSVQGADGYPPNFDGPVFNVSLRHQF